MLIHLQNLDGILSYSFVGSQEMKERIVHVKLVNQNFNCQETANGETFGYRSKRVVVIDSFRLSEGLRHKTNFVPLILTI